MKRRNFLALLAGLVSTSRLWWRLFTNQPSPIADPDTLRPEYDLEKLEVVKMGPGWTEKVKA